MRSESLYQIELEGAGGGTGKPGGAQILLNTKITNILNFLLLLSIFFFILGSLVIIILNNVLF